MKDGKIPLKKVAALILTSILCIGGLAIGGIMLFRNLTVQHMRHEKYIISAVAQTCSEQERLKTVYLAELLGLSVDQPSNFYQFDVDKARQRLESNPLIKAARVAKIPSKTIYVDYTLRKPIAFLGDFTNTAMDEEGHLFPFKPFFTPKSLPEITVGLSSFGNSAGSSEGDHGCWGGALQGHRAELALKLYQLIQMHCGKEGMGRLVKIDTSKAFALSYGQRQIVVVLEDRIVKEHQGHPQVCIYPKILRLSTREHCQGLANYLSLNQKLLHEAAKETTSGFIGATIIDLRIPHLAFIKTLNN